MEERFCECRFHRVPLRSEDPQEQGWASYGVSFSLVGIIGNFDESKQSFSVVAENDHCTAYIRYSGYTFMYGNDAEKEIKAADFLEGASVDELVYGSSAPFKFVVCRLAV